MASRLAFLFSGQGSQYYQMGRQLFEEHSRFRLWMEHCDELIAPTLGVRLKDIIYGSDQKDKPFDRLRYSNPALVAIEYALAKIIMESGHKPEVLVGYSLGELSAAAISDAVSLSDALTLSIDFAEIMEQQSAPGSILAILESPQIMEQYPSWFSGCYFAGANFDRHFVVSGLASDIQRLHQQLKNNNVISQVLPVNYAFHSPVMQNLLNAFLDAISRVDFCEPKIPVWSAYLCAPVALFNETHFWSVVREPIQFSTTILNLIAKGDYLFVDAGPSGTLATFVKYLLPQQSKSVSLETLNQYGRDIASFGKLIEKLAAYRRSAELIAMT